MTESVKVTLSTGKEVLLRKLQIRHIQMAERASGGNQGMAFAVEVLKQLIIKVDGKAPKPVELEDLDGLFEVDEFVQLGSVVGKFAGGATQEPKVETIFGEP